MWVVCDPSKDQAHYGDLATVEDARVTDAMSASIFIRPGESEKRRVTKAPAK
jgi:hypothetical protein